MTAFQGDFMKILSCAIVALAVALMPFAARAADHAPGADAETKYQTLLAAAKAGVGPVDWTALRYADADRPGFVPDRPNLDRNAMFKAMNAKDWQGALDLANRVIDADFTDALAHLVVSAACRQLGRTDESAREGAIASGLLASIRTGDGKSFDTAFTVMAVREEYDLLLTMHVKLVRQSLNTHDNHQFDVMDTTDPTGAAVTYYFQIDREWAAENRALMPH